MGASDGGTLHHGLGGGAPLLPGSGPVIISSTALLRAVEQTAEGSLSAELRASFLLPEVQSGMEAALVRAEAAGLKAALLAAPSTSLHRGPLPRGGLGQPGVAGGG
jgi:hypothetical protein